MNYLSIVWSDRYFWAMWLGVSLFLYLIFCLRTRKSALPKMNLTPRDSLEFDMNMRLGSENDVVSTTMYMIWSAVVSSTRAFRMVKLKTPTGSQRIYVAVTLRYWARFFLWKHDKWLKLADSRAKEYIPDGWKCLIHYNREDS